MTEVVETRAVESGATLDETVWDGFSLASVSVEKLLRSLVSSASLQVIVEDPTSLGGNFKTA